MSSSTERVSAAEQTLESECSQLIEVLNTQLDKETLATCVSMIESGVNAEGLAMVVQELRREKAAVVIE